jgi:hypothetical protein
MSSSSGSKGGGGDASWGEVLVAILVLGGGYVGLMFLLEHCTDGKAKPAPYTLCPCEPSLGVPVRDSTVPRNAQAWVHSGRGNYRLHDLTAPGNPVDLGAERFNADLPHFEMTRVKLPPLVGGHRYSITYPSGRMTANMTEFTAAAEDDTTPPTLTIEKLDITMLIDDTHAVPVVDLKATSDDAIVYRAIIHDPLNIATYTTTLDGLRALGDGACALPFHFTIGNETCIDLVAIDIANNASALVTRCTQVTKKPFDASAVPCAPTLRP